MYWLNLVRAVFAVLASPVSGVVQSDRRWSWRCSSPISSTLWPKACCSPGWSKRRLKKCQLAILDGAAEAAREIQPHAGVPAKKSKFTPATTFPLPSRRDCPAPVPGHRVSQATFRHRLRYQLAAALHPSSTSPTVHVAVVVMICQTIKLHCT